MAEHTGWSTRFSVQSVLWNTQSLLTKWGNRNLLSRTLRCSFYAASSRAVGVTETNQFISVLVRRATSS
jgi:hypothetical protein